MSMSGIKVDEEVVVLFNDMKLRSTHKYATFKIENKKTIVVDVLGDPAETKSKEDDEDKFDELKSTLTLEPRYILYLFGFATREGRIINKLALIFWCHDDAKTGDKMIYASSKDTLKKNFAGLRMEFHANDYSDFDYSCFADEVEKKA